MYKLPSEKIRARIEAADARYFANDNISEFLEEGDKDDLVDELMIKFGDILDTLLIDQDNDPNSWELLVVLLRCISTRSWAVVMILHLK